MSAEITNPNLPAEPHRRHFLFVATAGFAAVGTGAAIWPLIDQMEPDRATIAAGAPVDVDLTKLDAGQQMLVRWRGAPIFIIKRPPQALKSLQDPTLENQLRDPHSDVAQQPAYAKNWHRSIQPNLLVLVGICTHLGCIPGYFPDASPNVPTSNWVGGLFCPCHGSKYDLAGRVYQGVPAPYNLPVPPYRFVSDKLLRIGENPPGSSFEITDVVQM